MNHIVTTLLAKSAGTAPGGGHASVVRRRPGVAAPALLVWLAGMAGVAVAGPPAAPTPQVVAGAPAAPPSACPPLLRHMLPRLQDEAPIDLCGYAGRVLLVVNTASECGYTPQYQGLEALHRRYAERGLVVLGVPSNDFGRQEPGSNAQIADFCSNQFDVRFPMFARSPVRGPAANPLHAALTRLSGEAPGWNFHKYLVARDGRSVQSFPSALDPQDPRLIREIERRLTED
jgi:glutathione peroxidase